MIAIGLLGVGLVMVAAVFPVALSQHRETTEAAAIVTMSHTGRSLFETRVDESRLWRPVTTGVLPAGEDGPWMMLPFLNLVTDGSGAGTPGTWDTTGYAIAYAQGANAVFNTLGAVTTQSVSLFFGPADVLSDGRQPVAVATLSADGVAELTATRYVWYGFYRETAAGVIDRAVAVCRQVRGQEFAEQDQSAGFPAWRDNPIQSAGIRRRLPVPWRVSVTNQFNIATGDYYLVCGGTDNLGNLAPVGGEILIAGWSNSGTGLPNPAGRVITVNDAIDADGNGYAEWIRADNIADIPTNVAFDIWIFPPAFAPDGRPGGMVRDQARSPALEWYLF